MERARRCLGAFDGGTKERTRCKQALKSVDQMARPTPARTLWTAGARRDGHRRFALGHALVHKGTPGRPKQTCKKGVHVRGKHTGSPAQKKGPKRPTYQSPWREHPETARTIAETDIHAHHAEAFWRALRRQWAPCRSKTKTYATATTGWQRLLRVYGVVPHCLRVHLTTRAVPAVALGILERRLSVQEMFQIQMAEAMISKGKTVPMKLNQCPCDRRQLPGEGTGPARRHPHSRAAQSR